MTLPKDIFQSDPYKLNKHFDFLKRRIEELINSDKNIEAFLLIAGFLESTLKNYVQDFDDIYRSHLTLHGFEWRPLKQKWLEKQTMGSAIVSFERYCKDDLLIENLRQRTSFRNTLVHKLIDQDLDELNRVALDEIEEVKKTIIRLIRLRNSTMTYLMFTWLKQIGAINQLKHVFYDSKCGGILSMKHSEEAYSFTCKQCDYVEEKNVDDPKVFEYFDSIFSAQEF